jgi:uncharacterized protein (DUF433 family)
VAVPGGGVRFPSRFVAAAVLAGVRLSDVLDLLSNGLTSQQVLEELPDLEPEDIQARLQYASRKLNHPVLVGA